MILSLGTEQFSVFIIMGFDSDIIRRTSFLVDGTGIERDGISGFGIED